MGETVVVRSHLRLVASDFYGYYRPSECGLRIWLREQGVEEAPPSPYSEVLMRLGREHEERHLARFPNAIDLSDGSLEERAERTLEAIADGERVIYQGVLSTEIELDGHEVGIVGIPDFMLPGAPRLRDPRLEARADESTTAPTPRSSFSSRPMAGSTSRCSASRRSLSRSTTASARSPTSPTRAAEGARGPR